MLDADKLWMLLEKNYSILVNEIDEERILIEKMWREFIRDVALQDLIRQKKSSLLVPSWDGNLSEKRTIALNDCGYDVLAVDGSQIYPDRHTGINCSLINIGGAYFHYDEQSVFERFSEPFIYAAHYNENHELSADSVDAYRHELELKRSFDLALQYRRQMGCDPFVLFDGSLIFWHLIDKPRVRDFYLERYCAILKKFYDEQINLACFISLPKSKELINLIRLVLKYKNTNVAINNSADADMLRSFLFPGERTIMFENHVSIVGEYPEHMRPYFFYFNTGPEVVRIETPFWIANDDDRLKRLELIIADQCLKGDGYPIALAEAHEAAVVKHRDQKMFFHMIQCLTHRTTMSRKLSKKNRPLA